MRHTLPVVLMTLLAAAPALAQTPAAAPSAPLRIGGQTKAPERIHYVAPAYPAVAMAARVSGTVIIEATIRVAFAVMLFATLSFLGLGQQPPAPSWGSMLNTAQRFIAQAPWMAFWPGFAIFCAVLSFNLLGDGLRDALDPKIDRR